MAKCVMCGKDLEDGNYVCKIPCAEKMWSESNPENIVYEDAITKFNQMSSGLGLINVYDDVLIVHQPCQVNINGKAYDVSQGRYKITDSGLIRMG